MQLNILPRFVGLALGCLICSSHTYAAPASVQSRYDDMYTKDRAGRGIADWTHIVWLGPQTYPQPLIWLSRDRLNLMGWPERSVILSSAEYRSVERVSLIAYIDRPVRSIIDGKMGAFRVTQRMQSAKPRTYYLSAVEGCRYMATILALDNVNWTVERRAPFLDYERICEFIKQPLE